MNKFFAVVLVSICVITSGWYQLRQMGVVFSGSKSSEIKELTARCDRLEGQLLAVQAATEGNKTAWQVISNRLREAAELMEGLRGVSQERAHGEAMQAVCAIAAMAHGEERAKWFNYCLEHHGDVLGKEMVLSVFEAADKAR